MKKTTITLHFFFIVMLLSSLYSLAQQRRKIVLNEIGSLPVYHHAGPQKPTELFSYLQLAQRFTLNTDRATLKKVLIRRQVLNNQPLAEVKFHQTKFRIHVYSCDSDGVNPGAEISAMPIEVTDKDSELISINLSKYQLDIRTPVFFVAIAYISDPYNERLTQISADNELLINMQPDTEKYMVSLQPFLGLSPVQGKDLNTRALTRDNKWVAYDYFYPDFTDFAITCILETP